MNFTLSDVHQSWQSRGRDLGLALPADASAADTIAAAARAGLLDPAADLLAAVLAVDALAEERAASAVALAVHSALVLHLARAGELPPPLGAALTALVRGETVGAAALSSEQVPVAAGGHLTGRASWVAPLTRDGFVAVGAFRQVDGGTAEPIVCGLWLTDGAVASPVDTAGLRGIVCGHVELAAAPYHEMGATVPAMALTRTLLAAAGLGMGRRALREALHAARRYERTGPGGEQTVQGLLADTATELDAATLLVWKAATAPALTLADASMAKLAVTEATQRAVARATQVIGGDSFQHGHIIEALAQDVRALELFAGRTEALREAVAQETLKA